MSELQKTILRLALTNCERRDRITGADVYYREVLADYFGFADHRAVNRRGSETIRANFGQSFNRKAIGSRRYQAAQAALSRAMRRLARRGLVTCLTGEHSRWSGANLTDCGIEVARTQRLTLLAAPAQPPAINQNELK